MLMKADHFIAAKLDDWIAYRDDSGIASAAVIPKLDFEAWDIILSSLKKFPLETMMEYKRELDFGDTGESEEKGHVESDSD